MEQENLNNKVKQKVNWDGEIWLHSKNEKNQDVLERNLDDGFKISFVFEGTKSIEQVNKELLSILIK